MNHHLLNRSLLCHFTLCSRPLSVANVNNGCDKPCASYLTLHLSDLNRLRWVILACGISSETWITKPNCTMVPGGGSFAISEVPRRCSMGYSTLSTVARAVCGLHLTLGSPVWGRLRKEMCYTVTQWSLQARRCLLRMGPRSIRSSGTQCKRPEMITPGLCGYSGVMMSCCFYNSSCVVSIGLHWSHRCLRRICQSFNGVVPVDSPQRGLFLVTPISCGRYPNHGICVCGTSKRLWSFAIMKLVCSITIALSLSTMMKP